jgi:hypothetical protein
MIDIDKIEAAAKEANRDDNTMGDIEEHWREANPATVLEMVATIRKQREVMQEVLRLLGPTAPECSGCAAEWEMAIKALEEALK